MHREVVLRRSAAVVDRRVSVAPMLDWTHAKIYLRIPRLTGPQSVAPLWHLLLAFLRAFLMLVTMMDVRVVRMVVV